MLNPSVRMLVDLRPALEGHAGIPQETRLLFRALAGARGVEVEGLLQHNAHFLAPGLTATVDGKQSSLTPGQQIDLLGRVVISIDRSVNPLHWTDRAGTAMHTIGMALRAKFGGKERLTGFDPSHFRDFVWRRVFARSLPPEDMDLVLNAHYRIMQIPWSALHICAEVTDRMGGSVYPCLDTGKFDMMIAQTPYPGTVSGNTRLVIRYHDAIPLLMPHTIANRAFQHRSHFQALRHNVHSGAWFACVSDSTRRQLLSVFPQVEDRSLTIHNVISQHYFNEESNPGRVSEIIDVRLNTDLRPSIDLRHVRHRLRAHGEPAPLEYLLVVSTIEPRKNHRTLLSAWETLRATRYPALKLVVAGTPGWHAGEIMGALHPWLERGEAFLLAELPPEDLRVLYKHARATVCPSFGEGFGFSGAEAMASGGVVVASDVEAHREIYLDAAEYFNPYSVDELIRAISGTIDPGHAAGRAALCARGALIARRYTADAVTPQWRDFVEAGKWRVAG